MYQQYASSSNDVHHNVAYMSHVAPPSSLSIGGGGMNPGLEGPGGGHQGHMGVAPLDTTHTRQHSIQMHPHQQQQQPQAHASTSAQSQSQSQPPLVATGDWTKDLVHLAKTAELKKHALTLQLHTAHILSAHASLETKGKAIQDLKEQKNKLESERTRLLNCLREINEDRDKADIQEAQMHKDCTELRARISHLTEGKYSAAKADVDRLRQELGQPPLPSLQSTLDDKSAQYLNERRLNGDGSSTMAYPPSAKRAATEVPLEGQSGSAGKRPRGRPKGSKNKSKGSDA